MVIKEKPQLASYMYREKYGHMYLVNEGENRLTTGQDKPVRFTRVSDLLWFPKITNVTLSHPNNVWELYIDARYVFWILGMVHFDISLLCSLQIYISSDLVKHKLMCCIVKYNNSFITKCSNYWKRWPGIPAIKLLNWGLTTLHVQFINFPTVRLLYST